MSVRVNVNALMEDFDRASGSCMIAAKSCDAMDKALFCAGAAYALECFPSCRKPEEFGSMVAALFGNAVANLEVAR